jgi:hypothetical protein
MTRLFIAGAALAVALAASLSGCGGVTMPDLTGGDVRLAKPAASSDQLPESEKLKVRPLAAEDLDCPIIDVAEGGSTLRVGGPANTDVRYQFSISDMARTCEPRGAQFALKMGISGLLLIGPAGKPGAYSGDLKIVVANSGDKKTIYEKVYKIDADTKDQSQVPFQLIPDPIMLPLTRTDLNDLFSVTIGFGTGKAAPPERHRAKKPKAEG